MPTPTTCTARCILLMEAPGGLFFAMPGVCAGRAARSIADRAKTIGGNDQLMRPKCVSLRPSDVQPRKEPVLADVTPIRDPATDALLTPQNAVLALIDYQPEQYAGVASVGHAELLAHVTML